MSDLPPGWDVYDPDDHDDAGTPEYRQEREAAAVRAERRRAAYEKSRSALLRARAQTRVALADRLGVAQGDLSTIEQQADLLLSTLAASVDSMGGELRLVIRFADDVVTLELDDLGRRLDDEEMEPGSAVPDPAVVAALGAFLGRFDHQEEKFHAVAAA